MPYPDKAARQRFAIKMATKCKCGGRPRTRTSKKPQQHQGETHSNKFWSIPLEKRNAEAIRIIRERGGDPND